MTIRKHLHSALIVSLLLLTAGCDQIADPLDPHNLIVGSWNWEKSEGGWGGTDTPQSSGRKMVMTVYAYETVTFAINDTIRRSYPYTIDRGIRPTDGSYRIELSILYDYGPEFDEVIMSHQDTLTLVPIHAFDAETRTFSRIRR